MSFSPFGLFTLKPIFHKKSDFNSEVLVVDDGNHKRIVVGGYTQSMSLKDNGKTDSYWDVFLFLAEKYFDGKLKLLILGLGGGTAAVLFANRYQDNVSITAVEIDPVMVEASKEMFDLDKYGVKIIVDDATKVLTSSLAKEKYDLILVDVYTAGDWPRSAETDTFFEQLKTHVTKEGIVMFNRIYSTSYQVDQAEFMERLTPYFHSVAAQPMLPGMHSSNVIVYASDRNLDT